MLFEAALWSMLGLIVGSFTNVLISRHRQSSLMGRSHCDHCSRTLAWYELVPVISWAVLRGRCRTCRTHIPAQYVLVEIMVAGLFCAIGLSSLAPISQALAAVIAMFFVAIAVYDIHKMIMPDVWVVSSAILALLYSVSLGGPSESETFVSLLISGPVIVLPLFALWFVSKGEWMGFGDVKFAFAIGWLLGVFGGFVALFYAFVIGAIAGLLLVYISSPQSAWLHQLTPTMRSLNMKHKVTMRSEVPFGPFLILGTIIVWFATLYGVTPILTIFGALVL